MEGWMRVYNMYKVKVYVMRVKGLLYGEGYLLLFFSQLY